MKNLLFPYFCRPIGWIIFIPALVAGALIFFNTITPEGVAAIVARDLIIIGIVAGGLMIACSKERIEDEMVRSIRLASLLNSIYINSIIVISSTLFLNEEQFLQFAVIDIAVLPALIAFNFRAEISRYHKMSENEEQD